jgi:toxin ParE1/3/4
MPTSKVIVSPAARRDLRGILRATIRKWDTQQRRDYELKIARAFERIAQFPEMGTLLSELNAETRAVRCEQHRIYYRIDGNVVHILRVLHVRMDVSGKFSSPQDRE